eukprot:767167-Hanusia_phi.AAC.1
MQMSDILQSLKSSRGANTPQHEIPAHLVDSLPYLRTRVLPLLRDAVRFEALWTLPLTMTALQVSEIIEHKPDNPALWLSQWFLKRSVDGTASKNAEGADENKLAQKQNTDNSLRVSDGSLAETARKNPRSEDLLDLAQTEGPALDDETESDAVGVHLEDFGFTIENSTLVNKNARSAEPAPEPTENFTERFSEEHLESMFQKGFLDRFYSERQQHQSLHPTDARLPGNGTAGAGPDAVRQEAPAAQEGTNEMLEEIRQTQRRLESMMQSKMFDESDHEDAEDGEAEDTSDDGLNSQEKAEAEDITRSVQLASQKPSEVPFDKVPPLFKPQGIAAEDAAEVKDVMKLAASPAKPRDTVSTSSGKTAANLTEGKYPERILVPLRRKRIKAGSEYDDIETLGSNAKWKAKTMKKSK